MRIRAHILALVCLLLPVVAHAQAYQPLINPHAQYLDANGKPLANGKIFTYVAGTSTKAATYTDSSGATSNSNPVITDSAGFATIYLDINKSYKIVLQNANGVQQWVADNVTGGVPTGGGGGTYPAAGIANSTGSAWGTSYNASNTIPANFVSILNQSTTGNAGTATALATAPALCPSGQFAQGILATGNATGCAASAGMVWPPPSASGVIPAFNGAGGWLTSYNNANPIPFNFLATTVPLAGSCAANQYQTASSNSGPTCSQVNYSQLTGTIPNAPTASAMSTNGTANQMWGMDSTGSTQGWQTPSTTGGGPTFPVHALNTTSTYAVTAADFAACTTFAISANAPTVQLPATTPPNGQCIWVINYGAGAPAVTRAGTQTINGASISLFPGASVAAYPMAYKVISDGTNYVAQRVYSGNFANIATGTTGVALVIGTSGSLSYSGTGIVNANQLLGTAVPALANGFLQYTSGTGFSWSSAGGGTPTYPLTVAGTVNSGGIPYASSATQESYSATLCATCVVLGGGAGAAPYAGADLDYTTGTLAIGAAAGSTGVLQLNGTTSGNFTITPSATANTATLGGSGYTSLLVPGGTVSAVSIGNAVNNGLIFPGNVQVVTSGTSSQTFSTGIVRCNASCVWSGSSSNQTATFQSGFDMATTGTGQAANATFRSGDFTTGTTSASATGSVTVRSGNNAATGGASQTVGNVTITTGGFTGASGASTAWTPGYLSLQQQYWADTTVTVGTLACFTTPGTSGQMPKVGTCTVTSNVPWIGIIASAPTGQSVSVVKSGHAAGVVSNASATDTAGYFVCVDTANAGKVTVGTTVCGAGLGVGIIDATGSGGTTHSVDVERY